MTDSMKNFLALASKDESLSRKLKALTAEITQEGWGVL